MFIRYYPAADIGIVEVWEVLVLVVASSVGEGRRVDVLDDDAGLGVVFAVEKVAGILSVKSTTVVPKVVAMGV